MSDQLQDLLKKVYDEGVAKAEAEADQIISKAKNEAEKQIKDAQAEADKIVAEAKKKAADQDKNTQSDLKMAAQHTINTLKAQITELILDEVYSRQVSKDFDDAEFSKKLMLEALEAWKSGEGEAEITISDSLKDKLEDQFIASMKKVLDNKLNLKFSSDIGKGFVIAPADGSYKISFTDEDFANLFKSYLRPRTSKLLFSS